MAKYLDSSGLSQLWTACKNTFLTTGGGDERYSPKSHSHNTITSLGNYTPTTSDSRSDYGIYTYNIYSGTPQSYMSVIGFGYSTSKIEISGSWGDDYTGHLYWRSKSDRSVTSYPWKNWVEILDTNNYSSYAAPASHTHDYLPLSGGTLSGNLSIVTSRESALTLGSTASGISGAIYLYATGSRYTKLVTAATGASHTITFPNADGTVSLEGHTHSYLPLSGGTLSGNVNVAKSISVGDNESTDDYYGISLYRSTNFVRQYGIYFGRTTASGSGTYGEATGAWATYFTTGDSYGWIFRHYSNGPVASISAAGTITGTKIVKSGGTSSQFLKADGSVDSNTYSLSSHNHDGTYVKSYGTTNDNIDSDWGQSFKTFDPIPQGTPPAQNPNISILSIGNDYDRRKQLAFLYSSDDIYYRRRTENGWYSWVKLLNSSNYTDYTVTKTGSGASGTWGINVSGSAGSVDWSNVANKPSTYTPAPHNHDGVYAASSHSHTSIASLSGYDISASQLSSDYPSGLSTHGIYGNGWPFSYGCGITSRGNGGAFQIAGQWNAAVNGSDDYDYPTEMYIRGRRDSFDVWTTWTRVLTDRNWTDVVDGRYLKLSGGSMTGNVRAATHFGFSNDPSGYDYGGLYRNSQITSGGDASTMWLYSYNDIAIYGKNVDISNNGSGSVTINGYTPWTSANFNPSNYSTTSHDHNGRYIRRYTTNQAHTYSNIDDIIYGESTIDGNTAGTSASSWADWNTTLLTLGCVGIRTKQLIFNYSKDDIYYRRYVDSGWTSMRTIAFTDQIPSVMSNSDIDTIII